MKHSTFEKVEENYREDNCQKKSEFIENAVILLRIFENEFERTVSLHCLERNIEEINQSK